MAAAIRNDSNPRAALDPVEREAHDWVVRFASGSATPDDLKEGKSWCERSPAHAAAFARASQLWEDLGPDAFRENRIAPRSPDVFRRPSRRALIGGALAASVAGGGAYLAVRPPFALWPSWSELTADYRTATGEQRRITLASRVIIEMNTQTSIAVESVAGGDAIRLISGEALIATAPGAATTFTLVAGDGRVETSNAKFNVRHDGLSVCVTCLDGEVRVKRETSTILLHAHEQITYGRQELGTIAAIDPVGVTAWREGLLIFHATPLRDVIREVNRYRPGRIVLLSDQLGNRLFSADFHVRNVDAIIPEVQRLFGAKVTSLPGGVVLLG